MKSFYVVLAVAFTAGLLSVAPAQAQLGGLLGGVGDTVDGLLGGGSDTGGTLGGIGDTVDNLLASGTGTDTGEIGIPDVATVSITSGSGGTNGTGTVLGGGGEGLNIPLGTVLGGDSGVTVNLPTLGGVLPPNTPVLPINGSNGTNGINGVNGIGIAGLNGFSGAGGGSGASGINGLNGSSRLQLLMRVLQNRAWLRFAQGNKLCLPTFGVANVASWVRPNEQGALQQMIAAYGSDIQTLQQLMSRCRNGQNRIVDISRVIGIDLREDGQIVVMTI